MHLKSYPLNVYSLLSDVAQFASKLGFQIVLDDEPSWLYPREYYGNQYEKLLIKGSKIYPEAMFGPTQDGVPFCWFINSLIFESKSQQKAKRYVFKDPKGNRYIHMVGYTSANQLSRYGVKQQVSFIDFYMSSGVSGVSLDQHPELKKTSFLCNIPQKVISIDMFGGKNSTGQLSLHVAVETTPQEFMHFGFGTLEKYLPFTGGDYTTATMSKFLIDPSGYGLAQEFGGVYSCSGDYSIDYIGTFGIPATIMYSPDLDKPNWPNSSILDPYWCLGGRSFSRRRDLHMGATSLKVHPNSTSESSYLGWIGNNPRYGFGGFLSAETLPAPNSFSGFSPLLPIYALINNGVDLEYSSIIGHFPNVRAIRIDTLNPRDDIMLGADTWSVYPQTCKSSALNSQLYNPYSGLALLK